MKKKKREARSTKGEEEEERVAKIFPLNIRSIRSIKDSLFNTRMNVPCIYVRRDSIHLHQTTIFALLYTASYTIY